VSVDITVPGGFNATDYKVWLIPGSNPVLSAPADPAAFISVVNPAAATNNDFTNLASGLYTVVAQENPTIIGSGCFSAPVQIELREALPPLLDMTAVSVNSNCGAAPGDGSLTITFATDPLDPFNPTFPPPPPPTGYIVATPTYTIDVDDIGGTSIISNETGHASGDVRVINGLKNTDYDVTITSSDGCPITKRFTVPFQPEIVELTDADITKAKALFCDPVLETNARIEVQRLSLIGGGVEDIDDYRFDWSNNVSLAPVIYTDMGNSTAVEKGEVFENGTNTVAMGTVKAGSYWLTVTKITDTPLSGGIGCPSIPFKIDIEDGSEDPTLQFDVKDDQSCDGANFDGEITVTATNTAMPGLGYVFDWTIIPGAPVTVATDNVTALTQIITNDPGDNIGEGSYTITVEYSDRSGGEYPASGELKCPGCC
jgi:hypothetical protein